MLSQAMRVRNRRFVYMQRVLVPDGYFERIVDDIVEMDAVLNEEQDDARMDASDDGDSNSEGTPSTASPSVYTAAHGTVTNLPPHAVPDLSDQDERMQERKWRVQAAQELFLAGVLPDMEYDDIDENDVYDDWQLMDREQEEAYFNQPDENDDDDDEKVVCTDTGTLDY